MNLTEPVRTTEPLTKALQLFLLAQDIARNTSAFFAKKGAGPGDVANREFMKQLRRQATEMLGGDFSEKKACKNASYTFDFYFPDEATAVEIALSLHNPISEYERDIFKCLLAREDGLAVDRLFFVARPGAFSRQGAPGPRLIADFVNKHFALKVELLELMPGVDPLDLIRRLEVQRQPKTAESEITGLHASPDQPH